jgi:S-layer homology domain
MSKTALLTAFSFVVGTTTPFIASVPTVAQTTFSDVSSTYWAKDFISSLAQRNVIAGFPDGTFRPNAPVTRAEFATMVGKAFTKNPVREAVNFVDVPSTYWAANAIESAYKTGFLSGYPGAVFRPNQRIPREQVLVSLVSGLNYTGSLPQDSVLEYYRDRAVIPNYARDKIAVATEQGIVVNYPDVQRLRPNKITTRAEVAAFIYQALVNSGSATAISSPYIVTRNNTPSPSLEVGVRIPSGTRFPVKYEAAQKILVAPNEPAPVPITLILSRDIVSTNGNLLIPSGTQVVGELVTIEEEKAAQFVARQLLLNNGQQLNIRATSSVISKIEIISKKGRVTTDRAIRNTALGAAAAAALTALTGGGAALGLVLGAGAGMTSSLIGPFRNRDRIELISIVPNTDLTLTLNADLLLYQRN